MNQLEKTETMLQAKEFLNQGKLPEALELFKKEVEVHPENGYAHYYIGFILFQLHRYGNALTAFNDAISLLQDDTKYQAACFYYRACIYQGLGNEEQMLLDLEESIRLNPEVVTPFLKRGDYYFSVHEYDKAEEDYHNMAKLNPGNPLPAVRLGQLAFLQGNKDEALQHYEYALKLDPDYAAAYVLQADCQVFDCKFEEAIENYVKALELKPGYQDAERGLINYFPESCNDMICSRLEKLSAQHINDAYWPSLIGHFHFFKGNYLTSISYYEEAFRRGGCSMMLGNISRAYLQMEEYPEAREYAERALEMDKNDDNAQYVLCKSLMEMELWEEARTKLEQYAELNPENGTIQQMLADVYRFEDDQQTALLHARLAVELSPEQPVCLYTLSKVEHDLGDTDAEREHLEKALSMVPDNAYSYNSLRCQILQSLGRVDESFAELAKTDPIHHWSYYLNMALSLAMDGKIEAAKENLVQSFKCGFHRFEMLSKATLLAPLQQIPDFVDLTNEAMYRYHANVIQRQFDKEDLEQASKHSTEVPITVEKESICVEGNVNGLPLKFIFDTGATDTTISSVDAAFMLKHGYLEERDLGGIQQYRTAGGDLIEGTIINLREVKIGSVTFKDVRAAIIKNQDAPLLLGQSVLGRLASYWIDNDTQTLFFTLGPTLHLDPQELSYFAFIADKDGYHFKSAEVYKIMHSMQHDTGSAYRVLEQYFLCSEADKALEFINNTLEHLELIDPSEVEDFRFTLLDFKRYFLFVLNKLEESLEVIEEMKKLQPDKFLPYYLAGWTLKQSNRLEEALKQISEAEKYEPNSVKSKLGKGIIASLQGRETEARECWTEGTLLECSETDFMYKAECYWRLGDREGCSEWTKKGIAMAELADPMTACDMYADAALNYAAIGKVEEGDAALQRSMEISKLPVQAIALLEDSKYLESLPAFQAYLKSNGEE